jgi:drug/metabolite transporter (DMT)-like permease
VVACFLWSSAFVGVKIGLLYHTPFQFAGFRFALAGLLLVPFVTKIKGIGNLLVKNFSFVFLLALLQVVIQYSLFYMGLNLVPASIAAMIIGSSPIFAAILAHLFIPGDQMTINKIAGIILGIAGVVIISIRSGISGDAAISLYGVLLLILSNIVSGIANVSIVLYKHRISALALTSGSLFLGGLLMILLSIPIEGIPEFSFPPIYFASLLWLSFLSAAALTIWNTLLQRSTTKVSELNVWKFLIPVMGAILSWVILPDDSPDIVSVAGMLVIGFSLVLVNISVRSKN